MESKDQSTEYQLSAELADEPLTSLRLVSSLHPSHSSIDPFSSSPLLLLTGTSEGAFRLWGFSEQGWRPEWMFSGALLHGEKGLAFCLCPVSSKHGVQSEALRVVSGGSDHKAKVWSVKSGGEMMETLVGHSGHVCSVDVMQSGDIVTGSFDKTAIIWRNGSKAYELQGHAHGVEVLALPNGDVVTASGTREAGVIFVWRGKEKTKEIPFAHKHIIRRLKRHPLGFVSCANDGYVKLWSSAGEEIWSVYAHPQQSDTDPFVYAIEVLPDGGVVSVGEDSTARIISSDGRLLQVLRHPAPPRDVTVLQNGDIVTASGDGIARIWTRSKDRVIDDARLAAYQEYVDLATHASVSSIPADQCHPETVLAQPGKRDGQVLVVDVRGKGPTVYQWNLSKNRWDEIGSAIGQRQKKPTLEGNEYDHIVQIDVGPPIGHIPLGFNRDDDPEEVAVKFCEKHRIESMHIPEIKKHLEQFADPLARARRLEEDSLKQSRKLVNIPCWKAEPYQLDTKIEIKKMESKALENNLELVNAKSQFAMSDKEILLFQSICAMLKETGSYHLDHLYTEPMGELITQKLLHWPVKLAVPIVDMLRVLLAHSGGFKIGEDPVVQDRLLAYLNHEGERILHLLVMRGLTNWISKRKKVSSQDSSDSTIQFIQKAASCLALAAKDSSATVYSAYIMFVFNFVSNFGRAGIKESDLYLLFGTALIEFLSDPAGHKERPTFFASISLSTILFVSSSAKKLFLDHYGAQLEQVITSLRRSSNPAIAESGKDMENVIKHY